MVKRRGEIEEWLRRIFFGGYKDHYIVFIKHRSNGEETLKPIPGGLICDVRRGCIYIRSGEVIPFHRVVEIRRKNGELVYKRN